MTEIENRTEHKEYFGKIKYCFIDWDGTLVKTPEAFFVAHQKLAKYLGSNAPFMMEDQQRLVSDERKISSIEKFLDIVGRKRVSQRRLGMLGRKRNEFYKEALRENALELLKNFDGLITFLKGKGMHLVITTASSRKLLDLILENQEKIKPKTFDLIETPDGNTKYLKARDKKVIYEFAIKKLAFQLGVKILPSECLAIEDTPGGVLSAREAGIGLVIAIPDGQTTESRFKFKGADLVIEDLDYLKKIWEIDANPNKIKEG